MTSAAAATTPEELLPALKEELHVEENVASDDIVIKEYNLLKFLRWKPNINRAAGRYRGLQQWRKENPFAWDDKPLLASQDEALRRVLEGEVIVAPDGMVDKQGRAVLVGRLRNNDRSDGRTPYDFVRMTIYTIDRVLENEHAQKNGLVVFHDMTDLSPKNLDIRIPKIMFNVSELTFFLYNKQMNLNTDAHLTSSGTHWPFSDSRSWHLCLQCSRILSCHDWSRIIDDTREAEGSSSLCGFIGRRV